MNFVHIVAIVAVGQFMAFGFLVGRARAAHGVKAPQVSGSEEFDRAFRVQMNTLELLVCFLPALFIASLYWPPLIMALIGVVYIVGRFIYRRTYLADPATRGTGFLLSIIPVAILLVAGLLGALIGLVSA